ncbi:B12-binding domain-containing radical SAM protein [Geomonas sp.]|uniref:B12-binding domain-containing radical SAM protein n=1 Tax=Geomonas sp. TaxID=2651584 RepID=UPI002B49C91B|nr:radical SAM protein [Geomonas sp.]HJV37074.1 radical SAM protein [Geomonas sp.]
MNITLVSIHPHRSPQAVPLACAFLKGALLADPPLKDSLRVELLDFFLDEAPPEALAEAILKQSPDLVGFSVYVWNREQAAAVASQLKTRVPSLTLFAGGAEPTANPAPLLQSGNFDFVITGEGESSLVEVVRRALRGADPAGVPGLLLPGEHSPQLPSPVDLPALPSPYLTGLLDPSIPGGALWQLSRGCDFACAFCFDHKGGGGVRRFPMERIEQELKLFARLGVPQVFVLDSTFNKIPSRAKEILRLIAKLAPGVHFHFEVRSEFIDPEMAELFASITCSLQIGLQSADPQVLHAVGRGFDREDFSYRVSLLNRSGAIFGFDLIYGLPGDTPATFRDSLDFALSLYPNHLDIFPLAVLPGTRLYAKAAQLGLEFPDRPPYTVSATPGFSREELEEAGRLAAACDIFYSRGKAVAWFNSVTGALKLSPCQLLQAFAGFLAKKGEAAEASLTEEEIWELQRGFLEEIFPQRKKGRLLPLALDLVDYHHLYALALLAPPPKPPTPRELKRLDLLRRPLVLASSAFLRSFNYEILDILESGEIDLAAFASCFRPATSYAVVYPAAGEVCTESISKPYFELLLRLDGKGEPGKLCRGLGIPTDEALSFLEFVVSEGIALPA